MRVRGDRAEVVHAAHICGLHAGRGNRYGVERVNTSSSYAASVGSGAAASGTMDDMPACYRGKLLFPDNTWGYTNHTMHATQFGCLPINSKTAWQYKYPFKELCTIMFAFGFSWVPICLAPLTLHRVLTATSADALRNSIGVLHLFPIIFFLPMLLLGWTAGALWPEDETAAMPLVVFKLAQLTNFGGFCGVMCLVACIASFMSTADSVVICGSLLFTNDIWWNVVRGDKVRRTAHRRLPVAPPH